MSTSVPPPHLRIFIVENHADTLKYFHFYLESEGHSVTHARSFAEALEAIPHAQCDVLISDIGLPDGSGWDLLSQLRARGLPHPPFAIAVSGFGAAADRERSRDAGFRHHLLKPFSPDAMDRLLQQAAAELVPAH